VKPVLLGTSSFLLVDDDRIADVVRNEAGTTLLSIAPWVLTSFWVRCTDPIRRADNGKCANKAPFVSDANEPLAS
jgi:hypothetical protein